MNTLGDTIHRRNAPTFAPLLGFEPPEWTLAAVCASVDPEVWFPEKGGSPREAKKVCEGCPVRSECLEYALDNSERFGIWGGLSERERHRLTRGTRPSRVVPCGTEAGYRAHYRRGERPCEQCRTFHNETTASNRRRQRASGAA